MARVHILLVLAVIGCALYVVMSQHKARNLLAELQQETDRAQQMEVEWGQLQLEQSTWAMPARVDKIAVNKLQMRVPKGQQTRLIYSKGSHESSVWP